GINLISSTIHSNVEGVQLSGISNITGKDMKGVQLSGITNINARNTVGTNISGLVNICGNDTKGASFCGGINIVGNESKGLSSAGLMNIAGKNTKGVQLSGIANIAGENTYGLALSGLLNVSGKDLNGMQTTALLNICGNKMKGLQLAALCNVGVNVKGVQAGITNICVGELKGVQLGIVNYSTDTTTIKIGLINVSPKTRVQMLLYGGNNTKLNLGVRFQNKMTYTILGVGTHYFDFKDKFSGSVFYRAGLYYPILSNLQISGDLGYAHIESFNNKSNNIPARLYSLQARVNLEYQPLKKLGIFVSGGYGIDRYYNRNQTFKDKPIIEIGFSLF
ncbi:MAG: hypothetical protein RR319_09435, partial [Bacteroides sp.]